MKARVTMIESGADYTDKKRRIRLKLADAVTGYNELKFTDEQLGCFAVNIDDEIEVEFHPLTAHARRAATSILPDSGLDKDDPYHAQPPALPKVAR